MECFQAAAVVGVANMSPHVCPPPTPCLPFPAVVEDAAARFYSACLARRALLVLRHEAAAVREALQAAAECRRRRQLAAILEAWRQHTAAAAEWLAEVSLVLRRRWLLRRWQANVKERQWQQWAEAAADASHGRHLLAAGIAAWQQHVQHERWRDGVHQAVVQLRLRNMLRW